MSREALANVRLIALTDRGVASAAQTLARLERLLRIAAPGSVLVQLRDRELAARERLRFGADLRALTRAHAQLFQVNDRLDLALLLDADGVHLGEHSVSSADARRLLGEHRFVTRACHDPERVASLDAEGVLLSPVLAPRKGAPALGVESLTRAAELLRSTARPARLFALGGVDAEDVAACLRGGAHGIAAISGVVGSDAPEAFLPALGIGV